MRAVSICLRSASEQTDFDTLRGVLIRTLGLDWRGMPGEPDGSEVATDCAEALWAAGFRRAAALSEDPS